MLRLLSLLVLSSLAVPYAGSLAQPPIPRAAPPRLAAPAGACPGIALSRFEQRFPDKVKRYGFEDTKLRPFLKMWQAGRRPDMPLPPERVTVYDLPGKPYLVGFSSRGCVIAFLTVERQRLLNWLRPELGWPV